MQILPGLNKVAFKAIIVTLYIFVFLFLALQVYSNNNDVLRDSTIQSMITFLSLIFGFNLVAFSFLNRTGDTKNKDNKDNATIYSYKLFSHIFIFVQAWAIVTVMYLISVSTSDQYIDDGEFMLDGWEANLAFGFFHMNFFFLIGTSFIFIYRAPNDDSDSGSSENSN